MSLSIFLGTLLTFTATAQYVTPTTGLVSWWQAEGNANDSADGNNGTLLNGGGYAAGVFGSAFAFDGINDHVRVPNSTNLKITSAITVGAWINRSSLGSFDEIISKWDATPVDQRSYTLGMHPDGRAYFGLSATGLNSDVSLLTTSVIPLNTWIHFAAAYDGSFARIYVNGAFAGQVAYTGGIFSGSDDLAIGGVVGGVGVGSGISFFHGKIDEAVIYNRALSSSEILILATVPEPSAMALLLLGFASTFLKSRTRRSRC